MAKRILWDEEEAALLLDTYLKVERQELGWKEAAESLSDFLRARRQQQGLPVDDKFRNVNGIKFQLTHMQNVVTHGKHGFKTGRPAAVFVEVFDLYNTDRAAFDRLLKRARSI